MATWSLRQQCRLFKRDTRKEGSWRLEVTDGEGRREEGRNRVTRTIVKQYTRCRWRVEWTRHKSSSAAAAATVEFIQAESEHRVASTSSLSFVSLAILNSCEKRQSRLSGGDRLLNFSSCILISALSFITISRPIHPERRSITQSPA